MGGISGLMKAIEELAGGQGGVGSIHIGTVTSVKPLAVRLGQLPLSREFLKVDPRCVYIPKQTEPPNPHLLVVGDEVLLATPDGQTYVVVSRVVSA